MLCKCGCGRDAGLYKSSFSALGIVAGEPKVYLKGHFRKGKHTAQCSKGHIRTPTNTNAGGKCRICANTNGKRSNRKHKEKNNKKHRDAYRKIRREVLEHYGHHCDCCGETREEFLALDHVHGGGNQHRKTITCNSVTVWVYKNNYPEGFRLLCHNCNFSLGAYGYCPHSKETQ